MKPVTETQYVGNCKYALELQAIINDTPCGLKGCSPNCLCPVNMNRCEDYEE